MSQEASCSLSANGISVVRRHWSLHEYDLIVVGCTRCLVSVGIASIFCADPLKHVEVHRRQSKGQTLFENLSNETSAVSSALWCFSAELLFILIQHFKHLTLTHAVRVDAINMPTIHTSEIIFVRKLSHDHTHTHTHTHGGPIVLQDHQRIVIHLRNVDTDIGLRADRRIQTDNVILFFSV